MGEGTSSGFSFNTQFTVGSNGGAGRFELSTPEPGYLFWEYHPCGADRDIDQPELELADTITSGTFSFKITSPAGDTITLTSSALTGTVNPNTSPVTLNNGSIIAGTWILAPASSGSTCVVTGGEFTMTLNASS